MLGSVSLLKSFIRARISLLLLLIVIAQGLYGQSQNYFCTDTLQALNDPQFHKINSWLQRSIYSSYYTLSPSEIVHRLLSTEAITLQWERYPCLNLSYHFLLSDALKKVGAHEEAEKTGLIALTLDSLLGNKHSKDILSHLASNAFEYSAFERAAHYYKLNYAAVQDDENPFGPLGGLNNLALTYLSMDSIQKAKQIFQDAYQFYKSKSLGPSTLLSSLLDNLSDIALLQMDTTEAIRLLHSKDSVLVSREQDTLKRYETWAKLAELYQFQDQHAESQIYLRKAQQLANQYSGFTAHQAYGLESIRLRYAIAQQDQQGVIRSLTRLQELQKKSGEEVSKLHREEVEALRQYADFNVAQERALSLMKIEQKEKEQKYQRRLTLLGGLAAVILLFSIFIYYYYRQKANRQKIKGLEMSVALNNSRLQNEQLEKALLKSNLDASEKEMTAIAMESVRRKEWVKEVMEKMDKVLDAPPGMQNEGFRKLYLEFVHQYQVQERLSHTHEHQELIQSSFLNKLKTSFPELSPAEVDLCILLRLGFSGKEIAVIRNVDPESIRKAKYRLRNKMKVQSPDGLRSLLNSY